MFNISVTPLLTHCGLKLNHRYWIHIKSYHFWNISVGIKTSGTLIYYWPDNHVSRKYKIRLCHLMPPQTHISVLGGTISKTGLQRSHDWNNYIHVKRRYKRCKFLLHYSITPLAPAITHLWAISWAIAGLEPTCFLFVRSSWNVLFKMCH